MARVESRPGRLPARARGFAVLAACVGVCQLAGCGAEPPPDVQSLPAAAEDEQPAADSEREGRMDLEAQVQAARSHLASRLEIREEAIELLEARTVTWADSSLGCSEPGQMYMQVLTSGSFIRLAVAEREFRYHAGEGRMPFLCPEGRGDSPLPERGRDLS
jgi:hypothetical protein